MDYEIVNTGIDDGIEPLGVNVGCSGAGTGCAIDIFCGASDTVCGCAKPQPKPDKLCGGGPVKQGVCDRPSPDRNCGGSSQNC